MYQRVFISSALLVLAALAGLFSTTGCANIIPPEGGPKDTLPPTLVRANPGDSTRQFSGNKISFSFDEYIDLQNVQENLLVSPTPKSAPVVESRLNTVTVRLRDTLEANTTYTLNFGGAIKDINESNILKNFTYTFSTGPYIDSLELSGRVILAETGKTDSTLIVMLHRNSDDSAVVNERPRYIAKVDGKGNFRFKNLPPATFAIYALKDQGGSRRYFDDTQLFGFADKPVTISQSNEPVTLYAYASKSAKEQAPATGPRNSARPRTGELTIERNRLRYQTNLVNAQQDLLVDFIMTFDTPLKAFDASKMQLSVDSTYTNPGAYTITKDSTSKQLTLVHSWKENTPYNLVLDKEFATDTTGKQLLKTDTLHFTTKKRGDYGGIKLRFRNLDLAKNPVLQFIVNGSLFRSYPLAGTEFNQALFIPGEYELRILFDNNKNGTWDPGEFFGKHKQPELVFPIERKITIKPNWQNEFDISL